MWKSNFRAFTVTLGTCSIEQKTCFLNAFFGALLMHRVFIQARLVLRFLNFCVVVQTLSGSKAAILGALVNFLKRSLIIGYQKHIALYIGACRMQSATWCLKDGAIDKRLHLPLEKRLTKIILSFLVNPLTTNVHIIQKPVSWFAEQINWLVSIWWEHWSLKD